MKTMYFQFQWKIKQNWMSKFFKNAETEAVRRIQQRAMDNDPDNSEDGTVPGA